MKYSLKVEEFAQLALALLAIYLQPVTISWWLWPLLFLSPDLGMMGYLINARVGALTYNLLHHKGIAAALIFLGYSFYWPWVLFLGLVMFAHAAFDRIAGYGLKYPDSFHHTHLGNIGKVKPTGAQ
jgi:hypothetical protein